MTLSELKTLLNTVLPDKVAYYAFPPKEAPLLPYITFYMTGSDNFGADNIVYHAATPVRIELYEALRDSTTEGSLESALTKAGLYWTRDDAYIDDEKCYELIYEVHTHG